MKQYEFEIFTFKCFKFRQKVAISPSPLTFDSRAVLKSLSNLTRAAE